VRIKMSRIAPDGYDVMVFKLDETGPTHINSGTAGASANLTDFGSPISNAQGIMGDAMYIPSAYLVNSRNGTGGANNTLISPNISLSAWVLIRRGTSYAAEICSKQYFLNGWSSPFLTFGFQTHTTSDGQCDLYITLNGTLQTQVRTPAAFPIPVGKWAHIGGTWDGTTSRFYINGSLSASSNFSGVIDYGTLGNRGQWQVGGIVGTTVNADSPVIIQDIRIASVVRPQSYFANIYYNGTFVNG
jgi:hypothetical protein